MSYARPDAPFNRLAIVSFVLGIVGGILPLLGNLLGVIFGHRARRQIKDRADRGNVLAIVGLILNYLSLVTYIGLGIFAVLAVLGVASLNGVTTTTSGTGNQPLNGKSTTYSECVVQANGNSAATAKCMRDYPLSVTN